MDFELTSHSRNLDFNVFNAFLVSLSNCKHVLNALNYNSAPQG